MPAREVAWRVFAGEYNQANLHVTEGGERAPSFIVTPLGARVNRLLVMGVLTSLEHVGKEGDVWKARISDPTGQFTVYAGQYQPEAAKALSELRPPALVAIVGKSRAYQPEGGLTLVSIRPEHIAVVSKEERDRWSLEASKQTLRRLSCVSAALDMAEPTPDALVAMGFPRDLAEGVLQALPHYGKPEMEAYKAMVRDALEAVATGKVPDRPPSLPPPSRNGAAVHVASASAAATAGAPAAPLAAAEEGEPDAAKLQAEERVAGLVKSLDDGKGAPWDSIVAEAAKTGLGEGDVEEAINSLLDKGLVYEPVLGRLRPM